MSENKRYSIVELSKCDQEKLFGMKHYRIVNTEIARKSNCGRYGIVGWTGDREPEILKKNGSIYSGDKWDLDFVFATNPARWGGAGTYVPIENRVSEWVSVHKKLVTWGAAAAAAGAGLYYLIG